MKEIIYYENKAKKKLIEELKKIKDFRKDDWKIIYPLHEVLFMSLIAMLKGNYTFEAIQNWMNFNYNNSLFLKLFNKNKIDIPTKSTLHKILINVDSESLELLFRKYFEKFVSMKNIAIDGKYLNGSDVNGEYTKASHKVMLNVLDKDTKIVIAHKILTNKMSEIPAFKELLKEKEKLGVFNKNGHIFSFDAIQTQHEILNIIDSYNNKYIARVKRNQQGLQNKLISTISNFDKPTEIHENKSSKREGNKEVSRKIEVFQNSSCNLVMYDKNFKNIQTIVKLTKTIIDLKKTGKENKTENIEYFIANFKSNAQHYKNIIIQHWRIETYHYHLDKVTREDNHIAYVNPYAISILRSFVINLYQIFLNKHDGTKIIVDGIQMKTNVSIANIYRYCKESDKFIFNIFET